MQRVAAFLGLVSLLGLGVSAVRADDTLLFEQSVEGLSTFLSQCARPVVADLPADRSELRPMNFLEKQAAHGTQNGDAFLNSTNTINVFDADNECRVGMSESDPELIRTALNEILSHSQTGFVRSRYRRDTRGGFRIEFFRRENDRLVTIRARVSGYAIDGHDQAQLTVRASSFGNGRSR